jgi:hypothetical protein
MKIHRCKVDFFILSIINEQEDRLAAGIGLNRALIVLLKVVV